MSKRVSCIIPAYNEAATIGNVVTTVLQHPEILQLIVVDDGSSDGTAEIVANIPGATILVNEVNLGKGGAVQRALGQITGDIVLMLDADLINMSVDHVDCLLKPVLMNEGVTTLGVFTQGGHLGTEMAMRVYPFLSGQRAMHRKDLEGLPDLGEVGYGIEMELTKHIQEKGLSVLHVYLKGMRHLLKEEKMGFLAGSAQQFKMYFEVLKKMMELDTKPKEPIRDGVKKQAEEAAEDVVRLMSKGLKFDNLSEEGREWQKEVKTAWDKFRDLIKVKG